MPSERVKKGGWRWWRGKIEKVCLKEIFYRQREEMKAKGVELGRVQSVGKYRGTSERGDWWAQEY